MKVSFFILLMLMACDENKVGDMDQTLPPQPEVSEQARVYFSTLSNNVGIVCPFYVQMEVEGVSVDTAGSLKKNSGHHHLLVNSGFIPQGEMIPNDLQQYDFQNAETEHELNLPSGVYKLTLQFVDGAHRSYGEKLSSTITIQVH